MRYSLTIPELIDRLVEGVNYKAELQRSYPDPIPRERRARSIDDIKRWAEAHAQRRNKPTLGTFLSDLALNAGEAPDRKEEEQDVDQVILMTLHAAKGLEFPAVYMIGLEEGLLPHGRSAREGNIEEERRLMYVGITRAKLELILSHTRERNKFGTRVKSMPSRFIYELKGCAPPEDWIPAGLEPDEKKAMQKKAKKNANAKNPTPKKWNSAPY
jgi:superfamily I DNA/RNA helicase